MELITFRFPTQIRYGAGARRALADFASTLAARRPLLVTDGGLVDTPAYRLVGKEMARVWGSNWHAFNGVHPNPLEEDAEAGFEVYEQAACDAVIGLGGGSAIDAAKAIVLKIGYPKLSITEAPLAALPERIVPLCAIPTTAGTGSEVGRSTVITSAALGRKVVLGGPPLLPQLAILDPELTVSLPPLLTAATGMDAMTHAMESFVCPVFHPLCDGIALEAMYRIKRYLPRAVKRGEDIEARGQMLVAASMGAVAFQKDLGAAHSLAHPLSTEFGINHGLANAVVLPAVVRFNGEEDAQQYARVAHTLDLPGELDGAEDPARRVASYLEALNKEIGITQRLRDLEVPEDRLEDLAGKAFEDGCHLTNPRSCSKDDLLRLYKECW